MSRRRYKGTIPFHSKTGNPIDYVSSWIRHVEYRENIPFTATLVFRRIERGRSSLRGVFEDTSKGVFYRMFAADFEDALHIMQEGVLPESCYCFGKRGTNYGLMFYKEEAS